MRGGNPTKHLVASLSACSFGVQNFSSKPLHFTAAKTMSRRLCGRPQPLRMDEGGNHKGCYIYSIHFYVHCSFQPGGMDPRNSLMFSRSVPQNANKTWRSATRVPQKELNWNFRTLENGMLLDFRAFDYRLLVWLCYLVIWKSGHSPGPIFQLLQRIMSSSWPRTFTAHIIDALNIQSNCNSGSTLAAQSELVQHQLNSLPTIQPSPAL